MTSYSEGVILHKQAELRGLPVTTFTAVFSLVGRSLRVAVVIQFES